MQKIEVKIKKVKVDLVKPKNRLCRNLLRRRDRILMKVNGEIWVKRERERGEGKMEMKEGEKSENPFNHSLENLEVSNSTVRRKSDSLKNGSSPKPTLITIIDASRNNRNISPSFQFFLFQTFI